MNQLITALFTLFTLIILGYYMGKADIISQDFNKRLSKLLIRVVVPVSLFSNAFTQFQDRAMFSQLKYILLSFVLILGSYLLLVPICKALRIDPEKVGIIRSACTFSNTLFMGLPIVVALFGEAAQIYVVLYFASNTFLFWVMGVYFYSPAKSKPTLAQLIAPPVRGFIIGLACALLGIKLPTFLQNSISSIGALSTPLAMIYIGGMFYFSDLKSILKIDKDLILSLSYKLLIFPVLVLLILALPIFSSVPLLLKQTFCLVASMPTQSQVALAAGERNIHPEYANALVLASTLISGVTIPLLSILILQLT